VQVNSQDDILNAKKLLFPGVGSYGQAMNELKRQGYVEALTEYIQARPMLPELTTHCTNYPIIHALSSWGGPIPSNG
jgi:hypothetical protein